MVSVVVINAPVLLITWNRPDTTSRVLAAVAQADPPRLYVAADGPRPNQRRDAELCQATREQVLLYPGRAKILKKYEKHNNGARAAILSAIDWFFSYEQEGIILEDDSIPTAGFFSFCEFGLEMFRDNPRIFQISGTNHLKGSIPIEDAYYFSRHHHIWGFATYRRSWEQYQDLRKKTPIELRYLSRRLRNETFASRRVWLRRVTAEFLGRDDNWDSGWNFAGKLTGGLSLAPRAPLVSNVGFDSRALHSNRLPLISGGPPRAEDFLGSTWPPKLDKPLIPDVWADKYTARIQWQAQPRLILVAFAALEYIRRAFPQRDSMNNSLMPECRKSLTVAELAWGLYGRLSRRIAMKTSRRSGRPLATP